MTSRVPAWLYASVAVTALLCLYSIWQRYQVESKNKAVGIVAEADLIQTLAAAQGLTFDQALKKLKDRGLTGVVIPEETVADLISDGRAVIAPSVIRFTDPDPSMRDRVARGISNRFPMFFGQGVDILTDRLPAGLARSTSIGLDPLVASAVRSEGLDIVARLGNPIGATETYVKESIKWAAELGATVFLPQGEQVLGRRDATQALIDQLQQSKMLYATPEFAKIGGDANVVATAPEIVVRLHSAQTQELDKLGLPDAIERFSKAASERNQRVLLLRPQSNAALAPVDDFGSFVSKVRGRLHKEGLEPGRPHPFEDSAVPAWLFVAIAISTLPVFFFLSQTVDGRGNPGATMLVAVIGLHAFATFLPAARGPFALACAMTYPFLAFLLLDKSPVSIWLGYIRTSCISLVGGLCVAGLLNGLPFFVKADAFSGVKVAHFLPVALIGIYFASRFISVKDSLRSPIFWGQAALGLLLLAAFGFMAMRTGNESPAGVSGLELKFRALMDQFLYVRPRTKEFLIGHPAMIIALGLLATHKRVTGWAVILLMVGAIGQTSMVNTMCHLHTPVTLSLARIGVGWVLGGIIGAMVWGVLRLKVARHAN